MTEYEVEEYSMKRHNNDDIVELIIHSTDGHIWEYAIPFSRATGRYAFEEISVVALDFGDDFSDQLGDELDALVAKLVEAEA